MLIIYKFIAILKQIKFMANITTEAASAFRQNLTSLARRLRRESQNTPHTWSTMLLLSAIDHAEDGITPGELARSEDFRTSNLATMLKGLEARGLIVRIKDSDDRRRVRVYLTETARQLLSENRRKRDEWLFKAMIDGLKQEEVDVLLKAGEIMKTIADSGIK
ncbi:TPA: MarR family transcriptional regulator [Klebsiella pneumoniae]|jgi:DNA-binding MarR family transcriptional regulator|uniref:Transcriptional regulator SlyA n=2 Tax=Klebsiella TaxID=570 RepID=A0AAX2BYC7_KLEPN|nr:MULTISPECIES: MarR family transcriptional regulator [Klebsiella]HCM5150464.1 MarR family transcriptional regulator [Klebsiella aerogenes]HDS3618568.1 MarR family transcriptional regulator [Klebsiella pneumoniae subsp. pneumoniae]EIX9594650.1 MarR family transcriptional regulator [Klebsiella pneumoniae]EIY2761523.1 MarR family transcriptional regulator [Klebsiella pneumoniae]EKW7372388.1 MarR family transcriptional regulator [Klebsiella pneumoniae]